MTRSPVPSRPWGATVALLLLTPAIGIAIRFAHLGLPWSVRKYGGSALWAIMIYWVCSALLYKLSSARAAILSLAIATAVEYLKLVHTPALERFRGTLAGVLLLGRQFSYRDILVYALAITAAALADQLVRSGFRSPGQDTPPAAAS